MTDGMIDELRKALDAAEDIQGMLEALTVTVSVHGVEVEEEGTYLVILRVVSK